MLARLHTIRWRIISRLLPLLIVSFGVVLWTLGGRIKALLDQANLETARTSGLAVVSAVQASMLTPGAHPRWSRVVEKIPRDLGSHIDIFDTHGAVLFSTDRQRSRPAGLGDQPCVGCHAGGARHATARTLFLRDPAGASYQLYGAPLRNDPECRTCHDRVGPKLGMVFVRRPLEPVHRQLRRVELGLLAAGAISLLATILIIRALLWRYLSRPLQKLNAAARALGSGDLQHRVELEDHADLDVLARTLNTSSARLAALQKELLANERLAAIGETVAGMAHCLKNILNGLRAGQYVIDHAMERPDPEKLARGWKVLKAAIERVEQLTSDMLYCARERVPQRAPVDANQVLCEVADLLQEAGSAQGVSLRTELDQSCAEMALDRTAIFRAVLNLACNSIDACSESEHGDLVILRSRASADGLILAVQDNGVGMSEAVQRELFTRGFSTKTTRDTGLGLRVVRKITEEHGGRLEVESRPGEGSLFSMHLPRAGS